MALLREWNERHNPDEATKVAIYGWQEATIEPERAVTLLEAFEQWLQQKSGPAPDLVACVAHYGHTRLLLHGWRLPIDVPVSEYDQWRTEYHRMTLEEFQDRLAEVAGGFLELAGYEPQLSVQIIQQQLDEKLAQLEELANKPIEEYTPQFTEAALRARLPAEGLHGEALENEIREYMSDSDEMDETDEFDRPFVLRQQLECFEWGMEKFRMFALSDHSPEIPLPNRELYDALMQIDLNGLIARYTAVDDKLRAILKHLARHNYYKLNVPYEPESFWWRHWKRQGSGDGKRKPSPRTKPQR